MRVLHIVPLYLPHVGGVEVLIHGLIQEQRRRDHEAMVICSTAIGAEQSGDFDGVNVLRVRFNDALRLRDPGMMLRARRDVAEAVREFVPDVVHAHDIGPFTWFYRQATRGRREPLVFTVHTLTDRFSGSKAGFAAMLRSAAWVTGVSRTVRNEVLEVEPSISQRLSVVMNGVAPSGSTATPVPTTTVRLVCVGRLVPEKRFDLAVRALARLSNTYPGARLVIAGGGPEDRALRSLAGELGVQDQIEFAGLVDHAAVWQLLESATLLVAPSDVEGLSLAAIEAAWAGRPAIGTIGTGLSDAIVDGETGVLVPRNDVDAIARAIGDLLAVPTRLQALGSAARARAEREFSLETCADRYEALYKRLLAQEPRSERV